MLERFLLEPADDDRTHVSYSLGTAVKPWIRPLLPVVRWKLNRLFRNGLDGLQAKMNELPSGSS